MSKFLKQQKELKVNPKQIAVSWTGQAGFSFKDEVCLTYHVDPYLSNVSSRYIGYHRAIPTPVEAQELIGDFFLFTHEHRDHLDTDSVPFIAEANPNAIFIGPPACVSRLLELDISPKRIITLKRGESKTIGNAEVKAVLAYHTDDSVGFVIKFNEVTVYITGDTTYSDDLIPIKDENPDLMMSCVNGRLGCLSIADAVRLTTHIQPKIAIPMHIHMFTENTASGEEYVRQVELNSGITKGIVMEHGGWYLYSREEGLKHGGAV